jgi:hypothetical protein
MRDENECHDRKRASDWDGSLRLSVDLPTGSGLKGKLAMIARSIETRIVKLETKQLRPDEILVIWREPNGDVAAAASRAQFAAGDKVICAEWFGETLPPEPRWYRRLSSDMDPREYDYVNRSLERLDDTNRQSGFAPMPHVPHHRLVELTDNELLHIALGIET